MTRSGFALALALAASLTLGACTTPAGPVEVTRFVAEDRQGLLGSGTIFVTAAQIEGANTQALLPYQAAVARELTSLGYRETGLAEAGQVAQVRIDQAVVGADRSPVSVGGGGSVGSYGSGAGVGIGINLGGGRKQQLSTQLEVRIVDKASDKTLWEGRAIFDAPAGSIMSDSAQNASVMADALFRSFPGSNGETFEVRINE